MLASYIAAAVSSGCAKGQAISDEDVVFLDPRRPEPPMDASADGGLEPPVETPVDSRPDADSPPPEVPPPAPDSGSPPAPDDAGIDASAAADGG